MLVELIIQQEIQLSFWERALILVGSKQKLCNNCIIIFRKFLYKICVKTCPDDGKKHICTTEDVSLRVYHNTRIVNNIVNGRLWRCVMDYLLIVTFFLNNCSMTARIEF